MKRTTIHDVAHVAGVSTGTVSAVINAKRSVKDETRQKVMGAIRQLGYQPSTPARMMGAASGAVSRASAVGFIAKELNNPQFTRVVKGARDFFEKKGFQLMLCSSEGDYHTENQILSSFRNHFLAGAIVAPSNEDEADLTHLFVNHQLNYPLVLLEAIPGLQVNVVSVDNMEATQRATQYLIDSGHENIIYITGPSHLPHSRDRVLGFQRAFSKSRLQTKPDMMIQGGAHLEDGYHAGLTHFRRYSPETRPSAVVCFNDLVALGLMRALSELGIRVPGDVSVIGFDDIPVSAYTSVPLSTVAIPKYDIGVKAAKLLFKTLKEPSEPPKRAMLHADLIVRASTRPLA